MNGLLLSPVVPKLLNKALGDPGVELTLAVLFSCIAVPLEKSV